MTALLWIMGFAFTGGLAREINVKPPTLAETLGMFLLWPMCLGHLVGQAIKKWEDGEG